MIKVKDSLREHNIKKERSDRFFILYVFLLVLLLLVYTFLSSYVFFNIKVSGSSMNPTLYGVGDDGDVLIVNRKKTPEHGDIVIIAGVEEYWLIKRVIAMEGDTVKIDDGKVYLKNSSTNGVFVELSEPYASNDETLTEGTKLGEKFEDGYTLKENEVFYLGDNRSKYGSSDSRDKDVCTEENVIGVVTEWSVKNKELLRKFYAIPNALKKFFAPNK